MLSARPFPIIAYYSSWTGEVADLPLDRLTHINYSFAFPTPEGGLEDFDKIKLAELARRGRDQGVKVGLAVGGWHDGDCTAFEAMASRSQNRQAFVGHLAALCETLDLDGIDIDWEYPRPHSATEFAQLMAELDAALRPGKFLSTAVIAQGDAIGSGVLPQVFGHIDYLNIMAYDWHFERGTPHSTYGLAESSLDYWIGRGCPPGKAVLGIPFYGRTATASAPYREILARDPGAAQRDESEGHYYNGLPTVRGKTALAMEKAGGVMFWELTQDAAGEHSLLAAIHETVSSGS